MIMNTILPVGPEELPALKELVDRTIAISYRSLYAPEARRWFSLYHSRRAMARELGRGACMLAIRRQGRPVATATLYRGQIKRVFVDPEYQRRGLGGLLMDRMEAEAVRQGLQRVYLYATPDSHTYYRRRGYETLCFAADDVNGAPLAYYLEQKWLVPAPEIDIIRALPGDAGELCDRQARAFGQVAALYGKAVLPAADTPEDVLRAIGEHVVLKAVLNGRIVGGVRGQRDTSGLGRVGRLFVSPGLRGRGLGSRLVYEVERAMSERERFELFTGSRSAKNLRLYRRLGYLPVRREPCGDYELIYMHKRNPFVDREVNT
jgi:GNAT superfamily N-acetyltransferase